MPLTLLLTIRRALVIYALHLERQRATCHPKHVIGCEQQIQGCAAATRWIEAQQPNDTEAPQLQAALANVSPACLPGVSR